jgi:hypothetical protein
VVDDEKLNAALRCNRQDALGNVHCRADPADISGIFDLQTVQRIVPIVDLIDTQSPVALSDDFV